MSHIPPPTTLPPGSRVCCYLRDSGGDSQEQSTGQQNAEIEAYCQRFGLILVKIFEDTARSGGSTKKREAFLELMDYSKEADHPTGVLLWNFARFARDMDDSAFYRALLRKNGMVIHSLTDPVPPGEFSRVIETLIDYANEEKRRQTSRDVKRGLLQRTRAGYQSGGPLARGYRALKVEIGLRRDGKPRIGTKLEPDPEIGPLVQLAFSMRAEGKSLHEIMEATHGKLYENKNCFSTFFSNRTYLGIGRCGNVEIESHHPALVDQGTWDAVRQVQERAKRNSPGNLLHPRRINSPSLLSGIAICIHCGTPVFREVSGGWKAYLCGKKRTKARRDVCEGRLINAANADKAVMDAVLTRILTADYVNELLDFVKAQLSDTTEVDRREKEARQALVVCQKAIERLILAIEATDSPAANDRLKERENERAGLQFELAGLQSRRNAAQFTVTPEALQLVLSVWKGEIEQARKDNDTRNLQSLLRRFVTKIELGYNVARIWYTYPIDAFGDSTVIDKNSSGPLVSYRVITKALEISWSKHDAPK